jgi:hypothetical protein
VMKILHLSTPTRCLKGRAIASPRLY